MKREVGTPQRSKEKSATAKDVTANASQDTEGIPEDLDSYFLDAWGFFSSFLLNERNPAFTIRVKVGV